MITVFLQNNYNDHFYIKCGSLLCNLRACLLVNVYPRFVLQGSTLRKRKMYEEFLSKVSILGKSMYQIVSRNYF